MASFYAENGKKLVVCTHGSRGSTAFLPERGFIDMPALKYPFRDTNGAGDNFFVGLLYGHLKGFSIEKSLQVATIMGGLSVTSAELVSPNLSEEKVAAKYQKFYKE